MKKQSPASAGLLISITLIFFRVVTSGIMGCCEEVNNFTRKGRIMAVELKNVELQIDEKKQRLYWNGKPIVTRSEFLVGTFVVTAAGISAIAASVTALVNVARLLMGK